MDGSLIGLALGIAVGLAVGWLAARSRHGGVGQRERLATAARLSAAETRAEGERQQRALAERLLQQSDHAARDLDRRLAVAEERLQSAGRLLDEQRRFAERARADLESSFRSLAANALRGNTEQFLALAERTMAAGQERARGELAARQQAIETLLAPLRESLGRLDQRTAEIEGARLEAYSRLDEQLRQLAETTSALQQRTLTLATALKGSQVRGRWGEIALRNVVELAGLTEHCDFEEQQAVAGGGRPDLVVRLPGDRRIAVDSKAPLGAYLEAAEATSDAERARALDRHVRDLREHVRSLAAREYPAALGEGFDLVVLFLPGDAFLDAAFSRDPDLQLGSLRAGVLIATPTTLVALLRTVAIYWQQQSLAENAERIAAAARLLYERAAAFGDRLGAIGRGLSQTLAAYNEAVGSFERRVLPAGRKLEELKVAEQSRRQLVMPEIVDEEPRGAERRAAEDDEA